jgi:GMP synthase (glutamine-hydrolysing)
MSHGDSITALPEGFRATAQTDSTPFAGLADPARHLYGIQFHPEVAHTPHGRDVLRNFVVGVAGVTPSWTPASFIESTVAEIRDRVDGHARAVGSDGKVICALSGGVDSAVAAALVHRAVGGRLTCIYVDHGLMRKREPVAAAGGPRTTHYGGTGCAQHSGARQSWPQIPTIELRRSRMTTSRHWPVASRPIRS